MIAQQGRVVAIEGDDALIRIGGTSGCPACDAGKGCGAGIFGRLLREQPATVRLANTVGAGVGDPVGLGIPENLFLWLVFRLYGLPLLAGLLGAVIGLAVAAGLGLAALPADLVTLACALVAAGALVAWSRRALKEFPWQTGVNVLHMARVSDEDSCSGAAALNTAGINLPTNEHERLKR